MVQISNAEQLREYIHSIHDFLRNSGIGYGMNAMKVFNVFYGLKLVENVREKIGLNETSFNKLVKMVDEFKQCKIHTTEYEITKGNFSQYLHNTVMKELYFSEKANPVLYFDIPRDINVEIYMQLVEYIKDIPTCNDKTGVTIKETYKVDLAGKIYEYFIGRDEQAISDLGAYFTDRHITQYIMNQSEPKLDDDGNIMPTIDMFGGSGGFTLTNIMKLKEKYGNKINWEEQLKNIYHFDVNEDVIKLAALEVFALTGVFPDRNRNFIRCNSFKSMLGNYDCKYKRIITNPPYGGDKTKKTPEQMDNDLIAEFIKNIEDDIDVNAQLEEIKNYNKKIKKEQDKRKVTSNTCSNRIRCFANEHKISNANDKESCSLIILMDFLDENSEAIGVLKEGVFFDNKYSKLREVLINNFNVTKIVSVPSDQFENTTTKTSIIFFDTHKKKTEEIIFCELVVEKEPNNVIEKIGNRYKVIKRKGDIFNVIDKEISRATLKELSEPTMIETKKGKKIEMIPRYDYSLSGKKYIKDNEIKCSDDYELKEIRSNYTLLEKSKRLASYAIPNGEFRYYSSGSKILKCPTADIAKLCVIIGHSGDGCLYMDDEFSTLLTNHILYNKNENHVKYLYNILKCLWKKFYEKCYIGSTVKNTNDESIKSFKIPMPKSPEKMDYWVKRISEPYDKQLKYKQELDETEQHVKDEVKRICEEEQCEDVRLKDVCEYIKTGKHLKDIERNGKKYPYYGTTKIMCYTDVEDYNEGQHVMLARKGDFNVMFLDGKFHSNDDTILIKPSTLNSRLVYYSIINLKSIIESNYSGSTVKGIKKTDVCDYKLKVPKNKRLLDDLEKSFDKIEKLQTKIKKYEDKYQNCLKELEMDIEGKLKKADETINDNTFDDENK